REHATRRLRRLPTLLAAGLAVAGAGGCGKDKGAAQGKKDDKAGATAAGAGAGGAAATQAALPPPLKDLTPEEQITQIVACAKAYEEWDKEAFRRCYVETPDVETVDDLEGAPLKTQNDVVVAWGAYRNAFTDFKEQIQLVLINGQKVALIGYVSGVHTGRSLGFAPTNKKLSQL